MLLTLPFPPDSTWWYRSHFSETHSCLSHSHKPSGPSHYRIYTHTVFRFFSPHLLANLIYLQHWTQTLPPLPTLPWSQYSVQLTTSSLREGIPGSSAGKDSACNAGGPCLIPWSGRSTGEEIGYPLQYSWASLVAQLIKNLPAMWKTWVWSLSWEDPWKRERLPTLVYWSEEFHGLYSPWGSQRVRHGRATFTFS